MFTASVFALWAIVTSLKFLIFCLSLRSSYRWFQAYIGFSLFKSISLWGAALAGAERGYFHVYYWGGLIENILIAVVAAHLWKLLFWPHEILPSSIFRTMQGMYVFLLAGTLLYILTCYSRQHPLASTIEHASLGALLGVLLLTVVLAKYLQIPWRNRATWIALGLFSYLIVSTFYPTPFAYLLAEMTWLCGFSSPETKLATLSIEELKELVQSAEELLPPKKPVTSQGEQKAKGQVI